MQRLTITRLIHDDAGDPTEVTVTDVPSMPAAERHITDPATLYKIVDNATGARRIAWIDPHTQTVDTIEIGPKTFGRADTARALALLGCTEWQAA
jgi:hypothetical protein